MNQIATIILTLLLSLLAFGEDLESSIIKVPNLIEQFLARTGSDGRLVIYPKGWLTANGGDGRASTATHQITCKIRIIFLSQYQCFSPPTHSQTGHETAPIQTPRLHLRGLEA